MHPLKRSSALQNHSSKNTLASLFLPSHRDHSRTCVLIHPYISRLSSSHRREKQQTTWTEADVLDCCHWIYIRPYPQSAPPPFFFEDIKRNHALHPTCLTSWPVYHVPNIFQSPKNIVCLIPECASTQNLWGNYAEQPTHICQPLCTHLGYWTRWQAGLGIFPNFLGWMKLHTLAIMTGCCCFITSKWGLHWSSEREGNSLRKCCILQEFDIPWDCLFWWPRYVAGTELNDLCPYASAQDSHHLFLKSCTSGI